jgi:hypothetical protein
MKRMIKNIAPFFLTALLCSCANYNTHSLYYKTAISELALHDFKENYSLIATDEINKRGYLLHNYDTLHLLANKKNLAFRNKITKKLFFYQFQTDQVYKRIECDSLWNVTNLISSFGPVY